MYPNNGLPPPLRVILVDDREKRRELLEKSLDEFGCRVVACVSLDEDLVSLVETHDPDVVILDMDAPGRDCLDSLERIKSKVPRPIVIFTKDDDGETIRRAVRAGVSAYIVDGLQRHRVRPIVEAAIARFEQFQSLEDELAAIRRQLAERKLVEKAKGLIMQQRGLSEAAAYQAMRKLAMRNNKRLAEVAEQVLAAAEILL